MSSVYESPSRDFEVETFPTSTYHQEPTLTVTASGYHNESSHSDWLPLAEVEKLHTALGAWIEKHRPQPAHVIDIDGDFWVEFEPDVFSLIGRISGNVLGDRLSLSQLAGSYGIESRTIR